MQLRAGSVEQIDIRGFFIEKQVEHEFRLLEAINVTKRIKKE